MEKERQTTEVFQKMYHNAKAKTNCESKEIQTESIENAYIFTEMVKKVKDDNNIEAEIS